ncbi:MAG: DUF3352 domain-containing protein [Intrasporangium sp.]|uniref:DUF3352 domain-containing protein n=1 Tax=Intrasporangium sp. TaxID=1925024 RepID=UPI002649CE22|nr:DUF3352 domain-containing protein [Intrasporangium sp.]MDN5794257.1 DUF3352 domain-containing protein [Intrasporangium sp.]
MTQPNDPTPQPTPGNRPDGTDQTQSIPQSDTQAMPTHYDYPGAAGGGPETDPASTADVPEPAPGQAAAEGVPFSDDAGPKSTRRRTGLVAAGLVGALALGGGIAFGVAQLSGDGAQPADVIPADALAYVRLDIDPSAGQKVAAVRFLNKIPEAKDILGADDMRKELWDRVVQESQNACLAKFDFAKDIAPWLGERAGLGVRPGKTDGQQNLVVVLQTSDAAQASDTLTRLTACSTESDEQTDVRTRDGYVLLTPKGQGDATLAALDKGSLAGNSTFSGDMGALGDQGIASMWFDAGKLATQVDAPGPTVGGTALSSVQGRAAMTVRFDPDYIELAGIGRGQDAVKRVDGNGAELASLPADTIGAVQLSGGAQLVDSAWPNLKKALDDLPGAGSGSDVSGMLEDQLGIKLPADLAVLLGKSFTLAMPEQALGSSLPTIGLKVAGTDAKRAEEVLTSLQDVSGGALQLDTKVDGDRLYAATTPGYTDALAQAGKLGDSDTFKTAIGDTSTMTGGVYLDLDRVEKYYLPEVGPEAHDALEALRAVGLNVSSTGDGEGTFSLRVVGN